MRSVQNMISLDIFRKLIDLKFSIDGAKIKLPRNKYTKNIQGFGVNIDNHLDRYGIPQGPQTVTVEFYDDEGNYHCYTKERRGNKLIDIYEV